MSKHLNKKITCDIIVVSLFRRIAMDNIIDKKKYYLRTFLRWLEAEFFGLFAFLFYAAFSTALGIAGNIIFGIIGILMLVCVMADFGYKAGAECRNKVKLHGAPECRSFGNSLGLISMAPSYILLGVLMLSKSGLIMNFLPAYKLLNSCFYPIISIFTPTAKVADASPALYIMMLFLPLFYFASLSISYKWGYDSVDIKTKLMYRNKQ